MIGLSDVTVRFGAQLLYAGVSWQLRAGGHYGLVGANGSGKSTLLRVLGGEMAPEEGRVSRPGALRIGTLAQDRFDYDDARALDVVLMGRPDLWSALSERERLLAEGDGSAQAGERLAELEVTIGDLDGYALESRAAALLAGLGIDQPRHARPMRELSSGLRLRVLLAQTLFSEPDLLLLDEPTNHLDISSIAWLESHLRGFRGTSVVVSHDRHFLNAVADTIADLDYGELRLYPGSYDDFDGEEVFAVDAVALGTVHGAKGLEWPVVFLPSLTDRRFPSSQTGQARNWLLPTSAFAAGRYEGSDADERRLFYVALTRARDWVALSSHQRVNTQGRQPSPYLVECCEYAISGGHPTGIDSRNSDTPDLTVTYSELAAYLTCPQSYLLRSQLGFLAPIQGEVGYGNAVHHMMRVIAEQTKANGELPTPRQINELLTHGFYLPFANKPGHRQMRENARRLVFKYVNDHPDDLLRTWATERPFELYLPGIVVSGRADVIYDSDSSEPQNLVIVDYKTSTGDVFEPLQLQVYADAGRREGLAVNAAFVHDMAATLRHKVAVDDDAIANAEETVLAASEALRQRDFSPTPEPAKCGSCDVRHLCSSAVS